MKKIDTHIDEYIIEKLDKLHNYIKLPIGIGISFSILYIIIFGFNDYVKNLFEWIIGGTIAVIAVDYITRKNKKEND